MHDGSLATLEEVVDFYSGDGRPNPSLDLEIRRMNLSPRENGHSLRSSARSRAVCAPGAVKRHLRAGRGVEPAVDSGRRRGNVAAVCPARGLN